jgi:hypothetical protein
MDSRDLVPIETECAGPGQTGKPLHIAVDWRIDPIEQRELGAWPQYRGFREPMAPV